MQSSLFDQLISSNDFQEEKYNKKKPYRNTLFFSFFVTQW